MATGTVGINFVITQGADGLRRLTLDAEGLRRAMQGVVQTNTRLSSTMRNASWATVIKSTADSLMQAQGVLKEFTQESADFTSAMRAANTMAGKDAKGFEDLRDKVAGLSKEIPLARDLLAKGLYETISNGVPEDNWIEFLNKSSRSAVGGMADLGQVVGVTSTVIKNYGLEWSAAGDIQDKIQLAAKNGKTSFGEMAAALPRVTGTAAQLGVGIDELMATFSTLTGVSGNTAEVSTQLAAVFSALVKPSSEAAAMAEEMGIKFDAASIQAAGGLQQFLVSLDKSVKDYSAMTGTLEQEVYGRLFGSAESLRALVPLQGNLAESFRRNVEAMKRSAGEMDFAYGEMSKGGAAEIQRMKNQWGGLTDFVAAATAKVIPFLDFAAPLTTSIANTIILTNSLRSLAIVQKATAAGGRLLSGTMTLMSRVATRGAATTRVFSAALRGSAYSATAAKIALRGLMIASGVGLAIAAVTAIVEHFSNTMGDAAEATGELTEAQEEARRKADELKAAREAEAATVKNARAQLERDISVLKNFKGTKEQELTLVNRLNESYGATMGYFSDLSGWYKALTANSEAYCRQLVAEARSRRLADQIADLQQRRHDVAYDEYGKPRLYSTQKLGFGTLASPHEIAKSTIADLKSKEAALQTQLDAAQKEMAAITMPTKGSAVKPDLGGAKGGKSKGAGAAKETGAVYRANAANANEYEENVRALNEQLGRLSVNETEAASRLIKEREAWQKKADMVRNAGKGEESRDAFRIDAKSISEVEANLRLLRDQYDNARSADDRDILAGRVALWESVLHSMQRTGAATEETTEKFNAQAKSISEISANIGILQKRFEDARTQPERDSLTAELKKWKRLEEAYRNTGEAATSWGDTMMEAWGETKGVASGIKSITGALDEDAGAWDRVTGIVDGFISVLKGIRAVVELIDKLTGKTNEETIAQTGATAAAAAHTAATGADTAAATANAVATEALASAKKSEAVASAAAEGAKVPFPGTPAAIAANVAAVVAALTSGLAVGAFASSGIVGGSSVSGDRLLARVNSGEMILNSTQQGRLFAMIDGRMRMPELPQTRLLAPSLPAIDFAAPAQSGGSVRFEIEGRTLVGVLANETRTASKSGRKTKIKL